VHATVLILLGCWLVSFALYANEHQANRCSLTIKIEDSQTGEALPGILRITDTHGKVVSAVPELVSRGQGVEEQGPIHDWWVVSRPCAVTGPAAPLVVQVVAGLETELAERRIDLSGQSEAEVRIPLVRFGNTSARGFRAGNTHLHLRKLSKAQADRYFREVPRADELNVVFVSYLERAGDDLEYTSNHYTPKDLKAISDRFVQFGYGQEHRHNFGSYGEGYGHVLLLDIPHIVPPVSIGPGITKRGADAPPLQTGIEETRRLGGKVVWAHTRFGSENVPNWITGHIDANNVLDGNEHGTYDDPYYRYLNIGLRVPLCTGTDWFLYDFARTYVTQSDVSTPTQWLQHLAAGKSFVTNGPLLEFTVDGQPLGSVLRLSGPKSLTIRGRASGRTNFHSLELVQNGSVVQSVLAHPESGHFAAELQADLAIDKPCWLALRTPERPKREDASATSFPRNELGSRLFAHTSPIYINLEDHGVFDRETAQGLLDKMKVDLKKVEAQAKFADESQRQRVARVYEEAIEVLTDRLGQEGAAP
jgi:hypothetical protein